MPTRFVRNLPEELSECLRCMAHAQHRSISAQVILLLQHALAETERSQQKILNNIRHRRSFHPPDASAPDSTTLLRKDRAR